jgi:hypothetical protein
VLAPSDDPNASDHHVLRDNNILHGICIELVHLMDVVPSAHTLLDGPLAGSTQAKAWLRRGAAHEALGDFTAAAADYAQAKVAGAGAKAKRATVRCRLPCWAAWILWAAAVFGHTSMVYYIRLLK